MKLDFKMATVIVIGLLLSSCVSNKKFAEMQTSMQDQLALANRQLGDCGVKLNEQMNKLTACETEKLRLMESNKLRQDQVDDLRVQLTDAKSVRDKQLTQVGDLTVLSQAANDNIKETLSQLEKKDKYIRLIQAAKSKADSINLALAVNLKSILRDGIADEDVEIKVDKTVVFINISDKMLFTSGSYNLTSRANEVLEKIAQIVKSRPELEVMVEGYTDNVPIKTSCIEDNWDLSVKRAAAVVKVLQRNYGVDPNKLIAAGRGEYNTLADNGTSEGRSINRRTRIVLLPKLNQFYDLLNPNMAAASPK